MNFQKLGVLFLLLSAQSQAETYYLKDGTKCVGIAKEFDKETYEIVSKNKGITRYKRVKKADVIKVTREDVEGKIVAELIALKETPDLMETEWYNEQLEKFKQFKDEFSSSASRFDVDSVRKSFVKEFEIIKAGGVKFDGEVITVEDKQSRIYDLEAGIKLREIEDLAKKRKYREALTLADAYRVDFSQSKHFTPYLEITRTTLKNYRGFLSLKVSLYNEYKINFEKKLSKLESAEKRVETEKVKTKIEEFEKKIKELKKQGVTWLPVLSIDKDSIVEVQKHLATYKEKFEKLAASYTEQDCGGIYTQAWKSVENKKFDQAKEKINILTGVEFNSSYLDSLLEFYEEEKDSYQEELRRKKRGHNIDVFDEFFNTDHRIQETIIEVFEALSGVKSAEDIQSVKSTLRVRASRMKRLMEYRKSLPAIEERDQTTLDYDLSVTVDASKTKLQKVYEEKAGNKKSIDIEELYLAFVNELPKLEELLTEEKLKELKKQIADNDFSLTRRSKGKIMQLIEGKFKVVPLSKAPTHFVLYFMSSEVETDNNIMKEIIKFYDNSVSKNPLVEMIMVEKGTDFEKGLTLAKEKSFPWLVLNGAKFKEYRLETIDSTTVPFIKMITDKGVEVASGFENIKSEMNKIKAKK